MPKRLRLVSNQETFDPTQEEVAKANLAKSLKRPLCAKCKISKRITVWETVAYRIDRAFLTIQKQLRGGVGSLTRDQVESLHRSHVLLTRASKAQYCELCVMNTVTYVLESFSMMVT